MPHIVFGSSGFHSLSSLKIVYHGEVIVNYDDMFLLSADEYNAIDDADINNTLKSYSATIGDACTTIIPLNP